MKKPLFAAALLATIAYPATAALPTFDTPAPVAFMEDAQTGAILFAKDADRRMPPASMAKMMTVYVAFDLIKQGKIRLDQHFTVTPDLWKRWHSQGSTMFLAVGEQPTVADLLHGIITLSGNDACVMLAESIAGTEPAFAGLMNQKAAQLGLTNSHFGTSNGWPDGGVTFVTARDLAKLATATIRDFPDLYKQFYSQTAFPWGKTMNGGAIAQENRNPLLGVISGADGLKTGHTDEAGYGFTGSAEQNGRRLVMVIAGLDTYNHRAEQSQNFMRWGFGAWNALPVVAKGRKVGEAQVQNGSSSTVGLIAPANLTIDVPAGTTPALQGRIEYQGPLKPGIKAGDHVADLIVSTPDLGEQRVPLVAESDVPPAGFFRRAWLGFWSLFGM